MATLKRYFGNSFVSSDNNSSNSGDSVGTKRFASFLPEVYAGSPNRVQRYAQYEEMDCDPIVKTSLNTIAEFCTQENDSTGQPFLVKFKDTDCTDEEKETLYQALDKWCYINNFKVRIFDLFRKTIQYGDCVFIRDPETFELIFVDPKNVEKVIVDETQGKQPETYVIKDLDFNIVAKTLTSLTTTSGVYPIPTITTAGNNYPNATFVGSSQSSRFVNSQTSQPIPAKHIVHFSLNTGMQPFWPFGPSILEPVFKVHKQKQLLEDAMVIYRVQRAPDRRVFYIDTGQLPTQKAMAHVERVKNEIQQRRIPSRSGGSTSVVDASYNPLSILDDYYFPVNSEGRGSKVEILPGGGEIGTINDLLYFNNQLIRGLGVPSSYVPSGPEDGTTAYTDGKSGTSYMQEFRFSVSCRRIQNILMPTFDYEFKLFLQKIGVAIEVSRFTLDMEEPESFSDYRIIEKDTAHFSILNQALGNPVFSKRFALKRFGGLSEAEILENEKLWAEENSNKLKGAAKNIQTQEEDLTFRNLGYKPPRVEKNTLVEPEEQEIQQSAEQTIQPSVEEIQPQEQQ